MNLASIWFCVLGAMFTAYAVLDGFDLGVGAVHLWLARDPDDRQRLIAAIGPVWNGNEVWLLAGGGMMVVAFPRVYAGAFSGFYLALIVVLWLLILRGIAIEFRHQMAHPMWASLWDAIFGAASLLLALLLGVALGNVVRGLPIGPDGFFQGTFTLLLNPYSLLTGALSVAVLGWHGVNYLRNKAAGALLERTRIWSRRLTWVALVAIILATAATFTLRGDVGENFISWPGLLILPLLTLTGLGFAWRSPANDAGDRRAFRGSALAIVGLLGSAAATVYPALLRSTVDPADSLTIMNAAAAPHGLATSLIANLAGMAAVVVYSSYVHRTFRGRLE